MRVIPNKGHEIAVIDPSKKYGEDGQYRKYSSDRPDLEEIIARALACGCEIRYYYHGLTTSDGEPIASKLVVTHVPPGHVQPFHTHGTLHEMTIVTWGCIIAVDSDALTEADKDAILKQGTRLTNGDMVVEDPGVRHTVMNPGPAYAIIYTVQTARIPLEKFPADWKR